MVTVHQRGRDNNRREVENLPVIEPRRLQRKQLKGNKRLVAECRHVRQVCEVHLVACQIFVADQHRVAEGGDAGHRNLRRQQPEIRCKRAHKQMRVEITDQDAEANRKRRAHSTRAVGCQRQAAPPREAWVAQRRSEEHHLKPRLTRGTNSSAVSAWHAQHPAHVRAFVLGAGVA